jgi:UDP-N-acetylglucosamine acyltransferase
MARCLGDDNVLLAYSHIAHDCVIGNHLVISSHSAVAGHVHVGDHVNIGWNRRHPSVLPDRRPRDGRGLLEVRPGRPAFRHRRRQSAAETKMINAVGLKRSGSARRRGRDGRS